MQSEGLTGFWPSQKQRQVALVLRVALVSKMAPAGEKGSAPRRSARTAAAPVKNSAPTSGGRQVLALHRSRLFDWKPTPVVAIACCPGAPLAAVAYDSGDLELWDLSLLACCQVSTLPVHSTAQLCSRCNVYTPTTTATTETPHTHHTHTHTHVHMITPTTCNPPQRVVCDDLGLTSLAWALDTLDQSWRCFAARLDGCLLELLWAEGRAIEAGETYGGAAWCLAAQPHTAIKPGKGGVGGWRPIWHPWA